MDLLLCAGHQSVVIRLSDSVQNQMQSHQSALRTITTPSRTESQTLTQRSLGNQGSGALLRGSWTISSRKLESNPKLSYSKMLI